MRHLRSMYLILEDHADLSITAKVTLNLGTKFKLMTQDVRRVAVSIKILH
jgi:hypothetical protein